MRLFVALQLEDRVKDALIQFIDSVRPHTQEGRFSHRENLHLTLSFIGETGKVAQAKRALHRVQAEPFVISTAGVGRFRRSTGDILWAGVAKMHSWKLWRSRFGKRWSRRALNWRTVPLLRT